MDLVEKKSLLLEISSNRVRQNTIGKAKGETVT